MNAPDPALPAVRGSVDRDGRLIAADPRLADLNTRAGGAPGAPLAVPQLATLARVARRLGGVIARSVTVADGDDDVVLWVRAAPTADGVELALTGWQHRAAWVPSPPDFGETDGGGPDDDEVGAELAWETDAALRLVHLDPGLGPDTMLGQPVTRLFALRETGSDGFPMLAAVAGVSAFDDQPATERGSGREAILRAVPRRDVDGRFAGFIGSARFATPSARPEPAVEALPAAFGTRLEQALRSPLSRIVANADSINGRGDGPLRDEYADYAADIATAGRHLLGLVDDLVDLQFVERDDFVVAQETVELGDLARRAAGLLTMRAEASGLRFDLPDPAQKLPATGEFRRVLQVLVNLIGNAVRHSPAGGTIWLRLQRVGPAAAVIVADQGDGIAEKDQARIFEKFAQVAPITPGGSGLGLYISRRLARAMAGELVVDSAPGEGARFVLTLPAVTGDAIPTTTAAPAADRATSGKSRPPASPRRARPRSSDQS